MAHSAFFHHFQTARVIALACLLFVAGCATVRPEQRAILSDPVMRFRAEERRAAALDRVLEDREGSTGGGAVQGGGCGCN